MAIHCSHAQTYQLWAYTVPIPGLTSYGHTLFPCPDLPAMGIHRPHAQTYQLWPYSVPMTRLTSYGHTLFPCPDLPAMSIHCSHAQTVPCGHSHTASAPWITHSWSPEQCGHAKNKQITILGLDSVTSRDSLRGTSFSQDLLMGASRFWLKVTDEERKCVPQIYVIQV